MSDFQIIHTPRGFEKAIWVDQRGEDCSLQQSSAISFEVNGCLDNPGSSYLWLGKEGPDRMHIDRDTAALLMLALSCWLETGHLNEGFTGEPL